MWRNIVRSIGPACRRFPFAVVAILVFALCSLGCLDFIPGLREHRAETLVFLFCSCFLFVDVTLIAEGRRWGIGKFSAASAIGLALVTWHSRGVGAHSSFLLEGALVLGMSAAPGLAERSSGRQVWSFGCRLCQHLGFTFFVTALIYLAAAAIIASLQSLFGLATGFSLYERMWLVAATLIGPMIGLGGIPSITSGADGDAVAPKTYRFIVLTVAIPALLVYAAILHAYFLKIALTGQLPKGTIGYMVAAFGATGLTTWLAAYGLPEDRAYVRFFRRSFHLLLVLPTVVLALGLLTRIGAYGITEQRYLLVLCALWFVFAIFLLLGRHRDRAPGPIQLGLVALLLFGSIGPWGADGLSTRSQSLRLLAILERNQAVRDGRLATDKTIAAEADRQSVASIVDYLDRGERSDFLLERVGLPQDGSNIRNVLTAHRIDFATAVHPETLVRVRRTKPENDGALDIGGFDRLIRVSLFGMKPEQHGWAAEFGGVDDPSVRFESNPDRLIVTGSAGESLPFDLAAIGRTLKEKDRPAASDFVIDRSVGRLRVRLIIAEILVTQERLDAPLRVEMLRGVLLIGGPSARPKVEAAKPLH